MSGFRVRVEALADDALIVVRGGTLDGATLRADGQSAHRRFGEYGISVFAAPEQADLVDLARDRLVRFHVLTLMTAGAIRAVGLELRPTFRHRITPSCSPTSSGTWNGCSPATLSSGRTRTPTPSDDMNIEIDIDVDWNEEDDTGLPWSFLDHASAISRIVPGNYVVAGRGTAVAVAEVVDVGEDGVVHLRPLKGPVADHHHLHGTRHPV